MPLLTVIITDRNTTPMFAKHRRLFTPFLTENGGSLCQCTWNEDGRDIEQAVPELYSAIKGYPDWRVIILVHPTQSYLHNNPFDFKCNHGKELEIRENSAKLVRLAHMLGGYPPLGVKEYKSGCIYYNAKAGAFLECRKEKNDDLVKNKNDPYSFFTQDDYKKFSNAGRNRFHKRFSANIKFRLYEVPYSNEEKAEHKKLTEMYSFKENRPKEIIILSTRDVLTRDDREATREIVRHAWQYHDEFESSGFWSIYPTKCRFLYFDLLNHEHTLFQRELWRFFLLALTLAVNEIPNQALQAYLLYKADIQINGKELQRFYNEYIKGLLSVQTVIEEHLLKEQNLTQEKKTEIVPDKYISVMFDHVDEEKIRMEYNEFGYSADCPASEENLWREHILGTKPVIDGILAAPQEIVAEKAMETRSVTDSFTGKEQVLDRFQLERIHRRIEEIEPKVINTKIFNKLNTDVYKAEVAEAGNIVKKFIKHRLTKGKVLIISMFSLLVFICGYIPYFINSAKISSKNLAASIGLAFTSLVLLAAGGFLVLWFLRHRLVKKIKEFNKTVRDVFDRVNKSAKAYSEYFSDVCTYMYARSLLSGVILKKDTEYSTGRILKTHLAAINNEINKCRELCSLYDLHLNTSMANIPLSDLDEELLTKMPSDCNLYELSPNNDKHTLDLDNTGKTLDAPYYFISGLTLVREEIYSKKGA